MRKGMTSQVARPSYYDRNQIVQALQFQSSVAPHVATQRFIYTVPAGKKAFIESVFSYIRRDTVPGSAAGAYSEITYTKSGGSAITLTLAYALTPTVGVFDAKSIPQLGSMAAGDAVAGNTSDASTTGTHFYIQSFKGIEFDA